MDETLQETISQVFQDRVATQAVILKDKANKARDLSRQADEAHSAYRALRNLTIAANDELNEERLKMLEILEGTKFTGMLIGNRDK